MRKFSLEHVLNEVSEIAEFATRPCDSVNSRSDSLCTPLHCVVGWEDPEYTRVLLDAGADVNARDEMNYTPLHRAIEVASDEVIEELLKRGADLSIRTRFGKAAAEMLAARRKK